MLVIIMSDSVNNGVPVQQSLNVLSNRDEFCHEFEGSVGEPIDHLEYDSDGDAADAIIRVFPVGVQCPHFSCPEKHEQATSLFARSDIIEQATSLLARSDIESREQLCEPSITEKNELNVKKSIEKIEMKTTTNYEANVSRPIMRFRKTFTIRFQEWLRRKKVKSSLPRRAREKQKRIEIEKALKRHARSHEHLRGLVRQRRLRYICDEHIRSVANQIVYEYEQKQEEIEAHLVQNRIKQALYQAERRNENPEERLREAEERAKRRKAPEERLREDYSLPFGRQCRMQTRPVYASSQRAQECVFVYNTLTTQCVVIESVLPVLDNATSFAVILQSIADWFRMKMSR